MKPTLEKTKEYADCWGIESLELLRATREIILTLITTETGLEYEAVKYTAERIGQLISSIELILGGKDERQT